MKPLRLAICDDSAFMRKALARLLEGEARVVVVGQACSGEELLEKVEAWAPDVITLDLSMPGIGGLETLDRLRRSHPEVPVVILSTHSSKDAPLTIEALHRGAADFLDKQQFSLVDFAALREALLEKVTSLASPGARKSSPPPPPRGARAPVAAPAATLARWDLLVLGASTGGPPALQQLLEDLGAPPPVPLVVVQHMPAGFTRPFAERLNAHLPMPVREAGHADRLLPGTVYIAPSGSHTRVKREGDRLMTVQTRYPEQVQHRPSVDVLFESAAESVGPRCGAVLLTGMGRDGAEGMAALRAGGGHTVAQGEASCVVYGMPKAAVELGAVCVSLDLSQIGAYLAQQMGMR